MHDFTNHERTLIAFFTYLQKCTTECVEKHRGNCQSMVVCSRVVVVEMVSKTTCVESSGMALQTPSPLCSQQKQNE